MRMLTPVQYVFKSRDIWEWFEQPGNERHLASFAAAMKGGSISAQNPDNILKSKEHRFFDLPLT